MSMETRRTDGSDSPQRECPDDGIDFSALVIAILKRKWMILKFVACAAILACLNSFLSPTLYRSAAIIEPTQQSRISLADATTLAMLQGGFSMGASAKLRAAFESRNMTISIIEKHDLLPVLYKNSWDAAEKRWKVQVPPTPEGGYSAMRGMLEINADRSANTLRLGIRATDPIQATKILNMYLEGVSEFLKNQELAEISAQRKTLEVQMPAANDPLLRIKIADAIANCIDREAWIMSQRYYGFRLLDPPFAPRERISPRPVKTLFTYVSVAFFVAVLLAIFMEFFNKFRANNLQKFEEIRRHVNRSGGKTPVRNFVSSLRRKTSKKR